METFNLQPFVLNNQSIFVFLASTDNTRTFCIKFTTYTYRYRVPCTDLYFRLTVFIWVLGPRVHIRNITVRFIFSALCSVRRTTWCLHSMLMPMPHMISDNSTTCHIRLEQCRDINLTSSFIRHYGSFLAEFGNTSTGLQCHDQYRNFQRLTLDYKNHHVKQILSENNLRKKLKGSQNIWKVSIIPRNSPMHRSTTVKQSQNWVGLTKNRSHMSDVRLNRRRTVVATIWCFVYRVIQRLRWIGMHMLNTT